MVTPLVLRLRTALGVVLTLVTCLRANLVATVVTRPTHPLQCGFSAPKPGPTCPATTFVAPLTSLTLPIPILPTTSAPMVVTRRVTVGLSIGTSTPASGRCIPTEIPWCRVSITDDMCRVSDTTLLRLVLTSPLLVPGKAERRIDLLARWLSMVPRL